MSQTEDKSAGGGRGGFAGYPHLLMTLLVLVGVSAVLGALLRLPGAAITVIWGLLGAWRLGTPSRWVRLWVLLGALAHVIAGVAMLALRVMLEHNGESMDGMEAFMLPIYGMVMIVLAAYVFCQMVLPGVQRELDRRLALVRGRTTEEEEEELTPSQKRELERKRAADSLAETVESIIVAFILAFLFRAFVVEAFVIPTGSMASTLMGEHNRYKSPTGYEYEYGDKSGETSPTCPLTRRQDAGGRIEHSKESGDRILVEKYSVLLGHLRRWSVVVFRNPRFPHDAALDARNENFIKRLVGLPNEIIMILDGDVYAAPASDELTAIHEARLELLAQYRRLEPRIAPRPPGTATSC